MTRDRITGILAAVLGAAVSMYALTLPSSSAEGDIGPAAFPLLAGAILLICGIVMIIKKSSPAEPFLPLLIQKKRFLLITLVYIFYGIALWAVGFLISTPIACLILCVMMSGERKINWGKLILFSLAVTAAVYYCFYTMLALKLPAGSLIHFML